MVKVKEFCCGFTLRTGTLILAWGVLIWNCIVFLMTSVYLILLFRVEKKYPSSKSNKPSESNLYILTYLLIESIIAIVISIVAMWAVQKKRAKYLNGLLWYFYYAAVIYGIAALLEIFNSPLDEDVTQDPFRELGVDIKKYKVLTFLINLFMIAIALYFALVVKSHRDYAFKNEIQREDFEAPNQTNDGYVNN